MFSILIPIIVTIIGFLYIVLLGRFVPGYRDDGLVLLVVVGTWLVYGFTTYITTAFTGVFGTKLGNFIFIAAVVVAIALYVKNKNK